jgi:hypothetical protein
MGGVGTRSGDWGGGREARPGERASPVREVREAAKESQVAGSDLGFLTAALGELGWYFFRRVNSPPGQALSRLQFWG